MQSISKKLFTEALRFSSFLRLAGTDLPSSLFSWQQLIEEFIGLECGADVQTFLFQGSSFRCAVGQDDIHQLFISDLNAAGPQSFCGRNTYDFCKEFPDTSVTKKQCVGAADAVGGCNGAGQAVFVFAQLVQQQAGVVIGSPPWRRRSVLWF